MMSAEPAIDKNSAYYELIKPISVRAKLGLAAEILSDYVRVRRLLLNGTLAQTVAALRTASDVPEGAMEGKHAQAAGLRLGNAVGRTLGLLPFDSRCLVRSLVLTSLLARRGVASTLVIAVSVEPEFSAHAWVEREGVALLPPLEESYHRLVEI